MIQPQFLEQVRLLLRLLPVISHEKEFFIKGGTAINFFIRDIPRLSVDIDLVYGVVADRVSSLRAIATGMESIMRGVRTGIPGCRLQEKRIGGCLTSIIVNAADTVVKLEMNTLLRGSVLPGQEREINRAINDRFNIDLYVTANTLSIPDLYGGKMCAALDRQHPRDLFDIQILFENEGIADEIRKAFVVYLAGHDRPMSELLAPRRLDIRAAFEGGFRGMTDRKITLEELEEVRECLISTIISALTDKERNFLLSMKAGEPQWEILELEGIDRLPALQWKLLNVRKMQKDKRAFALKKLERILMT